MRIAVAAVAAAALGGAGVYLLRGDRYRLYLDAQAGRCWQALESLALSSSSLRPVGVTRIERGGDVEVRIEYRLDRVLAGATLDATCVYAEGGEQAESIALDGMPLDAEALSRINGEGA